MRPRKDWQRAPSLGWVALMACLMCIWSFCFLWLSVRTARLAQLPPVEDPCPFVDVVYTWVNGSDPKHKDALRKVGKFWDAGFRDYGVMRYSIRTVEKYMPWVRRFYIVTNGQVPGWLNLTASRVRLVTHEEIFDNKRDLPTFNSNAIEAHLHNIPGIAPCFLYLNDDMFLTRDLPSSVFVDSLTGRFRLHFGRWKAPNLERMKSNLWHRSVGHTNEVLSHYYHPNASAVFGHYYIQHNCYFFRTNILDTMSARWRKEFEQTSSHKFREGEDMALPFMHANVALEEYNGIPDHSIGFSYFSTWKPDHSANMNAWKGLWSSHSYCACLNDDLDKTEASVQAIEDLAQQFELLFPSPSTVEIHDDRLRF